MPIVILIALYFIFIFDFEIELKKDDYEIFIKINGLLWVIIEYIQLWYYKRTETPSKWIDYKKTLKNKNDE